MRVDGKQFDALKRLAKSSDGRVLHSVIAAEHTATMKSLMSTPIDSVQRIQGRAALLDELVKLLDPEVE